MIRRCALCGRDIDVSLPYSKDYVYYKPKSKWYHIDCFTVVSTPRMNPNSWVKKTESFVTKEVSKDNISKLIQTHYNVTLVPQYVYIKLSKIYDGTYKGLAIPVPPEDLYEMLVRKMPYLDKIAARKGLSGISKFNYDLAVVIAKYDSYLEWKDRIESQNENTLSSQDSISYKPSYYLNHHTDKLDAANEELNINSIIDEIME